MKITSFFSNTQFYSDDIHFHFYFLSTKNEKGQDHFYLWSQPFSPHSKLLNKANLRIDLRNSRVLFPIKDNLIFLKQIPSIRIN